MFSNPQLKSLCDNHKERQSVSLFGGEMSDSQHRSTSVVTFSHSLFSCGLLARLRCNDHDLSKRFHAMG